MHTLAGIDIEQVATTAPTVHADIRIMTHNILYGWKWGRVLDLIRFERPDIICLQEVPHRDHRLGGYRSHDTRRATIRRETQQPILGDVGLDVGLPGQSIDPET